MSLASVAKQPDWFQLEYHPKRDIPVVAEGMKKDHNITPTPAKRGSKEPPQASASPNTEVNRASNTLPHGTRVIITTKAGTKVNGTVRWTGELPLEGDYQKQKIPVYGVETVSFLMGNICH